MNNIFKYKIDNIYIAGDLHGKFESINYQIKTHDIQNTLLIFCGDIGFGFEKRTHYTPIIRKINDLCKKRNNYIVFIRGNHDDPSYFNNKKIYKERVIAIEDYSVLQIYNKNNENIHNILCVGGGISIDRLYRQTVQKRRISEYLRYHKDTNIEDITLKIGNVYWENEINTYEEDKLINITNNNINIDIVCTHTSPSFCEPKTKDGIQYWLQFDEKLNEDLDLERDNMCKLYHFLINNNHLLLNWYYGHFHNNHCMKYENCNFYMIDMERGGIITFKEIHNNNEEL